MKDLNTGPLDDQAIVRLFERVIDESRRLERIMTTGKAQRKGSRAHAHHHETDRRRNSLDAVKEYLITRDFDIHQSTGANRSLLASSAIPIPWITTSSAPCRCAPGGQDHKGRVTQPHASGMTILDMHEHRNPLRRTAPHASCCRLCNHPRYQPTDNLAAGKGCVGCNTVWRNKQPVQEPRTPEITGVSKKQLRFQHPESDAIRNLQVQAAAVNADAVITTECRKANIDWFTNCFMLIECTGEAIQFINK